MASCGFQDPDHSYEGGRIQLNHGKCNGWLRSGQNDSLSIGYYERADLPFLGRAATDWTTFDRYFAAIMAETYPNRFYMHCARTDRLHNNTSFATMPSIWDRLHEKRVSQAYYYSDLPFAALLGSHGPRHFKQFPQFLLDCAAGKLPAVSFVEPRFQDEDKGLIFAPRQSFESVGAPLKTSLREAKSHREGSVQRFVLSSCRRLY